MPADASDQPGSATPPEGPPDALTFEDALAQVESIIERIESGEVGLEQSLADYERGVRLIHHCRHTLDRAAQQVEDLTKRLEGGQAE